MFSKEKMLSMFLKEGRTGSAFLVIKDWPSVSEAKYLETDLTQKTMKNRFLVSLLCPRAKNVAFGILTLDNLMKMYSLIYQMRIMKMYQFTVKNEINCISKASNYIRHTVGIYYILVLSATHFLG